MVSASFRQILTKSYITASMLWRSLWQNFIPSDRGQVTPFLKLRAGLVLLWERLAIDLWPLFAGIAIFFILALFDVLPLLPGWLHALTLILLSVSTMIYLQKLAPKMLWPQERDILRRIEMASDLQHRPLTTATDYLATRGLEQYGGGNIGANCCNRLKGCARVGQALVLHDMIAAAFAQFLFYCCF